MDNKFCSSSCSVLDLWIPRGKIRLLKTFDSIQNIVCVCVFGKQFKVLTLYALISFYLFTKFQEYGYSSKLGPDGSIPSGPDGSGVVVVTFFLMFVFTLIWMCKLITHKVGKAVDIGLEDKND